MSDPSSHPAGRGKAKASVPASGAMVPALFPEEAVPGAAAELIPGRGQAVLDETYLRLRCFELAAELLREARGRRTAEQLLQAAAALLAWVMLGLPEERRLRLSVIVVGVRFSSAALQTVGEVIAVAEMHMAFLRGHMPFVSGSESE